MFGYFQKPNFHYIDGNPLYFVNQDRLGIFLLMPNSYATGRYPVSIRFKLDVDELLRI